MNTDFTFYSTLTMNDFRWLLREAWEEDDLAFFAENRSTTPYPNFKSPPSPVHKDEKLDYRVGAQWVLKSFSDNQPIAWAECLHSSSKFSIASLLIGNPNKSSLIKEFEPEVVSHLISSILISTNADEIKVSMDNPQDQELMKESSWGKAEPIWLPISFPGFIFSNNPGIDFIQFVIDPIVWFESAQGSKDKEALHYLTLRRDRLMAKSNSSLLSKNRRSGGVLSRLFGR